ncbi:MAG TPA: UvrD-helicase domain-containing protein [Pirellulales bacterium]|jgi:DNA helicase-2/ATP-dependent DNA helicase PcrA|nr:UvrD-helicase domain-containing protein [Pirellulales bacterium]
MPHDLNDAQRAAVTTRSGPLLVLAGAGTGKTRVVTFRIAELIRHGTRPDRILGVTFTNKAAAEMQSRAAELLGKRLPAKPEISTFHSLCVRILRRNIRRLGYPETFTIYDRSDQEAAARGVLRELKVPGEALRPGDMLALVSRWKSASIGPQQATKEARTDKEHLASMAYRRYEQALKNAAALDFDDLLLKTEELLHRFAEAREAEAARFDHVLVDEYQDTNGSQYRIIRALAEKHRNLCVVGDDDQSIYGWRGAEVRHILRFKDDWPEAKIVRLEENYRSTDAILALANRLIRFNRQRHEKVLRASRIGGEKPRIVQYPDEATEAQQVVGEINGLIFNRRVQPRDVAILFRTNEQPRAFEAELRRLKLPYTLIGGMSFYDRKEVRDVLAYVKLLAQPDDEVALLRVVNTPPRGIGPRAVELLMAHAVERGERVWNTLPGVSTIERLPPAAREGLQKLQRLVEEYRRRAEREPLVDVVASLVHSIGYQQEIDRLYKEPNERSARWNSVEEVINALGQYQQRAKQPTLKGFLDEIALGNRDEENDKESKLARNAIVLMTLHAAKGLEFPHVYMIGMEEGLLPHHRSVAADDTAIDEERRLCYVGITRARDRLTMSLALSRHKWGKPRPTQPSRFLFELHGNADSPQAVAARKQAVPSAKGPKAGTAKRARR